MITRTLLLQMAGSRQLEHFARHNRIANAMAQRFIAGETIEQITEPVRQLNKRGFTVSLDFLGESVTSEQEIAGTVDTYLRLLQNIRSNELDANVSIKLTALGMDISPELASRNLQRLLKAAAPEIFVRIDMESSAHTDATLKIFRDIFTADVPLKNTGVVIQSYLRRSAADVEELINLGARVRLCKGAYQENATVAFPTKDEVDANYVRLLRRLMEHGVYPGIATHDKKMIDAAIQIKNELDLSPDKFEFQMLYGVRRELQEQLVSDGYRMRIYTPFGDHWYPYTMRRLAEKPANLKLALTSMVRG